MYSIIFFGDDQYSTIVLNAMLKSSRNTVSTVVTTTPKPQGRKDAITPNIVEETAQKAGVNILHYPDNKEDLNTFIASLQATLSKAPNPIGTLASFGKILPQNIIELFGKNGILCLHPSLLPQYRGATPGQYALALGDTTTGITLFQLTSKVDDGKILAQVPDAILPTDTTPTLLSRLFTLGSDLLINWLTGLTDTPIRRPTDLTDPLTHRPADLLLTRKFARATGFVEWPAFTKMLNNKPITLEDTQNPLLQLRLIGALKSPPAPSLTCLTDLLRALTPWPGVWTIAPTTKGDLRIALSSLSPNITVKIAGKPSPISLSDFIKYYQ